MQLMKFLRTINLPNISNFEQIKLIIDFFLRSQYFSSESLINIDLELIVERALLKIQENKIFHLAFLAQKKDLINLKNK